jgi:hypothetical protein
MFRDNEVETLTFTANKVVEDRELVGKSMMDKEMKHQLKHFIDGHHGAFVTLNHTDTHARKSLLSPDGTPALR